MKDVKLTWSEAMRWYSEGNLCVEHLEKIVGVTIIKKLDTISDDFVVHYEFYRDEVHYEVIAEPNQGIDNMSKITSILV